MLRLSALLASFCWLVLLSCNSPETAAPNVGLDYMPLTTGRFVIYDVTEQRYSLTAAPVTSTYQLKETVGVSYTDVTGQPAFRLQRFRRANVQAPWQIDSLWTARVDSRMAIRTENGADFVKLIFPPAERSRWNGNLFNQFQEDIYELRNVHQPYSVGTQTFAETATVLQQNDSTLVSQDKRVEVYARQVGLVYKETVQLQFCSSTPSCVGKAQIDFGVRRYVRLASYGTE
ncbi:hypothetical protein [Fibrella forsythiae]|uniref:Lipoprotein n=1 Tax=Fibrella forsythiae TaxID=2817061 RepID=A0ABS3JEU2_9BACT|nr:hypothetical protein [Fibrella forsythiae]MBO0948517.1 hypothetical protein [Fibrella forsythiae]